MPTRKVVFDPDRFGCTVKYIKQRYEADSKDWEKIHSRYKSAEGAGVLDEGITPLIWDEAIEHAKKQFAEQASQDKQRAAANDDATLSDYEVGEVKLSTNEDSCWQCYKSELSKRYLPSDVANIEESAFSVLRRLILSKQRDVRKKGRNDTVKGMVIGQVQSGKTGHLAGLMSMAADRGFNFFIVISGVIENLRVQTEVRLRKDLSGNSRKWVAITKENISMRGALPASERLKDVLRENHRLPERYYHVCLKNGTRLQQIMRWLRKDAKTLKNLKILIIDDEADQASINTRRMGLDYDAEKANRTVINGAILELTRLSAAAVNYVGYTATPAANLLSEPPGNHTLFPRDFIRSLPQSSSYFGPKEIHGADSTKLDGLPILREITHAEKNVINEIEAGNSRELPETLKDSIAWFLCASAFRRALKQNSPSTMLVHTSQLQDEHTRMADAIRQWLKGSEKNIIERCKKVWKRESSAFTKADLLKLYSGYDRPLGVKAIPDYLLFQDLLDHLKGMLRNVDSIKMEDEDGELEPGFEKDKIHLCIDNCRFGGTDEDNNHVRLLYPTDKDNIAHPTSFIVVGGATLSRGLTLEGLLSTYFLRKTNFGDTLMQMGRWFGYRIGYELMPRIWMTKDEMRNFRRMAFEEMDLRQSIERLVATEGNTEDYQISILTNPWFRPTAPNKMQGRIAASLDFSGSNIQTVNFQNDENILKNNITITEKFLKSLADPSSEKGGEKAVWKSVSAKKIIEFIDNLRISDGNRAFYNKKLFLKWLAKASDDPAIAEWNVIIAGIKRTDSKPWKIAKGINRIFRSRIKRESEEESFSIGTLLAPADRFADFPDDIKPPSGDLNDSEISAERSRVLGKDVPQLIIYRVDKDSPAPKRLPKEGAEESRVKLGAVEDLIGICLLIPGERRRNNPVDRLTVSRADTDQADRTDLNIGEQETVTSRISKSASIITANKLEMPNVTGKKEPLSRKRKK
jgi:hypothetical protein